MKFERIVVFRKSHIVYGWYEKFVNCSGLYPNSLKVAALRIPAICAFLCLFDVQIQTLITIEGINIF